MISQEMRERQFDLTRSFMAADGIKGLREISSIIKEVWNESNREHAIKYRVGDKVWFNSPKFGRIEGEVTRVNLVNLKVRATKGLKLGNWKVAPSLLHMLTHHLI